VNHARRRPGKNPYYGGGPALSAFAGHAYPQSSIGETLSGPDSHETGPGSAWSSLGRLGVVFGRTCSNEASGSIFNISVIISRNVHSDRNDRFCKLGTGSEGRSTSISER